jgi:hypothetical protein
MEKDFHFYLIYALAETAGFADDEAFTVAYASQFVDDNNEKQYPKKDGHPKFPSAIRLNGSYFRPIMTQSMSVKSLVYEVQKYVYVPFHFIPGDSTQPIKGETNKYATTPNCSKAQKLLKAAIKSEDLYRIGIALHSYADTWSHQNFTGYEEDWNSVFNWHSFYRIIVPNIAHADAGHDPDEISTVWKDYRLPKSERKIVNRVRAMDACKHIYQALRRAVKGERYWSDVKSAFRKIINVEDYDDRIDEIRTYVNKPDLHYKPETWLKEAIKIEGEKVQAAENFENTHWYKFQQAAKANLAFVVDMLKGY